MNNQVFINCPFDEAYAPLLEAILFSIYYCGFRPRCALEVANSSQNRLEKIYSIIEESDLGIHDISRTELNEDDLPRFNMPLELGIFLGARRFGGRKQKQKNCLIMDKEPFRYQKFISDIAGMDITSHKNKPEKMIAEIRAWLNAMDKSHSIPGASYIAEKYDQFRKERPVILKNLKLKESEVSYADLIVIITYWLKVTP